MVVVLVVQITTAVLAMVEAVVVLELQVKVLTAVLLVPHGILVAVEEPRRRVLLTLLKVETESLALF